MVFYDRYGHPVAYTEDETHIYLFTGKPVAYIAQDAVYSFGGNHLGWCNDGWIRDLNGECVFFSEHASGSGPVKPVKSICPVKSVKQVKTVKGVREIKHMRAINSLSWSPLSGEQFFTR